MIRWKECKRCLIPFRGGKATLCRSCREQKRSKLRAATLKRERHGRRPRRAA